MLNEPLAIQGFYNTRRIARQVIRAAVLLVLVAGALALATGAVAVAAIDVLLVSWGAS